MFASVSLWMIMPSKSKIDLRIVIRLIWAALSIIRRQFA
jgi:hypothetical protein